MKSAQFALHKMLAIKVILIFFCYHAQAEPPVEYSINYAGSMGSLRAESIRSLTYKSESDNYHMYAQSKVKLLGKSLTSITENATFNWRDDKPQPQEYQFEQKGLGARDRGAVFDFESNEASYWLDEKTGTLSISAEVFDDLTLYLAIRQQLLLEKTQIRFDVIDKDKVETYHFRVLDSENLNTELGILPAIHLERLRDEDSSRKTEFWLSTEHDFVLLKLLQVEPNGREINLEITAANIAGVDL